MEYGGAVCRQDEAGGQLRLVKDTDANLWRGYARFIAGYHDLRFACAGGISGGGELPLLINRGDYEIDM
jgi:hypothetical protein